MVSSWLSCSLIDQPHGAQWAESKWELNRLHQGFVALCSPPAWGSKFSHHRVGWSPGLLQIALCFTPVSRLALCFAFFLLPLSVHSLPPALSSLLLCSSPRQLHTDESCRFFFLGLAGEWATLVLTVLVCVCVCKRACVWTPPGQLRSALFLCGGHLMVWRRARGREGLFIFSPMLHSPRSKVDPIAAEQHA